MNELDNNDNLGQEDEKKRDDILKLLDFASDKSIKPLRIFNINLDAFLGVEEGDVSLQEGDVFTPDDKRKNENQAPSRFEEEGAKKLIESYMHQISRAAGEFNRDLVEARSDFKRFLSVTQCPDKKLFNISLLNSSIQKEFDEALKLRNLVTLQGINILTAAFERRGIIEPNSILEYGEHMIRLYGGLQSSMIDKDSLKILADSNPTISIRDEQGKLAGVYFYATQLNSDGRQSPQEKIIFGENFNALRFLKEKINCHNTSEKENLKKAISALVNQNLAYFATICTAPNARGRNIGTLLNYLTYKKAQETLRKKRDQSVPKENPGFVLQRYFSIGGVVENRNGNLHPFCDFQPSIGNKPAAALNQGTFSHIGTSSEFRCITDMTNINCGSEDIAMAASRLLDIPKDQVRNYFARIDNLFVLIDIDQAIKACEERIQKSSLIEKFKGLENF